MAGAIRRNARNLQRLAVRRVEEQDDQGGIQVRDYTLNMSSLAMKKKVTACDAEYKVKAVNCRGNQIF